MTAAEILQAIAKLNVLVVGDICLDRWCTYDPATAEASRETGIPRVGVVATEVTPGAGGTVANNLVALGVTRVALLGAIGEDGFAYELVRELSLRGISAELMVKSPVLSTFTYTKLINSKTGVEDLPRIDYITTQALPPGVERRIVHNLREYGPAFDVVIVADQAETQSGGVVTPAVREVLAAIGSAHPSKVIWVDSRMRLELFRNVIVKSNQDEADAASRRATGRVDYAYIVEKCGCPLQVVTCGSEGALLIDRTGETRVPARDVGTPVDICGAGDSFTAGAATALAAGASPVDAARFGNVVSSITIMKKGTGTASPDEVLRASAH
jgi:rfaE bifunctional protein kinase chain/domain